MWKIKHWVWVISILIVAGAVGIISGPEDRLSQQEETVAALQLPSETAQSGTTAPTATAVIKPVGVIAKQEGIPPRTRLEKAFQSVTREQVPTGILLDKGAISAKKLILQQDGSGKAPAISRFEYVNAYGDLVKSTVGIKLPARTTIDERSRVWREREKASPVSLMVVDYDTITADEKDELTVDGNGVLQLSEGRLGETRRYVAAAAQTDTVNYYNPTFVMAADLFVSNTATAAEIEELSVRFGTNEPQQVEFDTPFTLAELPQESGHYAMTVSFSLDQVQYTTKAIVEYNGPGPGGPTTPPPPDPIGCNGGSIWVDGKQIRYYDLQQVVATIPFSDPSDPAGESPFGVLNIRVYPGEGTVEDLGDGQCRFNLVGPIVAIDGFDYSNTRTQESIWNDFNKGFLKFLQWGFDVISIDYTNGRDWIQRNGYAVRELLVNGLENIVEPTVLTDNRLIVIGGSMGSQTGRWALRTAELAGEDHNTGLAIYFDGPFQGANIPISMHAMLDWGAQVFSGLDTFLEGLNSRAARQQLIRTRFKYGSGSTIWYERHPQGGAYYAQVNAAEFGLPRQCRNVTIASGSGTGSLQNDGSVAKLIYLDDSLWKDFWGVGVKAYAKTDFAVSSPIFDIFPWMRPAVFYGRADDRVLFNWIDLGIIPGGIRQMRLALETADYLDIAPGGYRGSPRQIMEAAADLGLAGKVHSDMEVHGFPPTYSALGVSTTNTHYIPASDPDIFNKVPFDNLFWEKCNRQHAEITDHSLGFVMREITAFLDGTPPPEAALFQTACEQPEPKDLCMGLVTWHADPDNPTDLIPWYDGANCYVTPVPNGYTGKIIDNNYYVVSHAECPDGTSAGGPGCELAVLDFANQSSVIYQLMGDAKLTIISEPLEGGDHLGPIDCPDESIYLGLTYYPNEDTYATFCQINVPAGHTPDDLVLSSGKIYLELDAGCAIGTQTSAEGDLLCYLGAAPEGMKAFVWPTNQGGFYYDGLD